MNKFILTFLTLTYLNCFYSIHFYLTGSEIRCFYEDLPNEIVLVGKVKVENLDPNTGNFAGDQDISLSVKANQVSDGVEVASHIIGAQGQFTFTSQDFGQHKICLSNTKATYFANAKLRVHLTIFLGGDAVDGLGQSDKAQTIRDRLNLINAWFDDILSDQNYISNKEDQFISLSSKTSSNITYWILLQIFIIAGTCYWQVNHLKQFFLTRRLV